MRQSIEEVSRTINHAGRYRLIPMLVAALHLCGPQTRVVGAFAVRRSFVARSLIVGNGSAVSSLSRSRHFSSSKAVEGGKKKNIKRKKWRVNENIGKENMDKLAQAFDELARKEGFDSSGARFADDATFEDDFDEDDLALFDENDEDDDLEDDEDGFMFDDGPLDFGGGGDDDDMMARIANAQRDVDRGSISVSRELDQFATGATAEALHRLGFRHEKDPYGIDETPRKEKVKLAENAMVCSACGADFQSTDEKKPGYLPPEKYQIQLKLSKIEEMERLQEKADSAEWSTDDEVDWLIQTSGKSESEIDQHSDIDIEAMAEEMGIDLFELSKKKVICKRCHGLQNFGKVDESLRPGWTEEPMLAQETFRNLLRPISEKPAVIIALVDLFDFMGSVLPELDSIAGENPVILAANKADLLPSKMGMTRAENWVRRELEYMGVKSLANIGGAVRLISCKTGLGVQAMLEKARNLAEEMDCDIYVVGAANAGKSTLLNFILGRRDGSAGPRKKRAGNANARKGVVTTSPLPGTTLKFIKVDLPGGRSLYDTPGLLVSGALTHLLTPEELKVVVPKSTVEPITFRVSAGKCVLIGGLARISLIGDSKPFLFTFYVANGIKLHPTDASKADEFIAKHAGELLTPPLAPGPERLEQLGELEHHDVNIEGAGWKEAAADIALTGLGWVAVTGAGRARVRISVPKGVGVSVRPPLMPFDVWESTAKYTGGRAVRKTTRTASGKRRKGVGRK